ncbi:hypothetical protein HOY82DRAFT_625513, partial [Tuber indicum]
NALLNHSFPFGQGYIVALQYERPRQSRSVDFTTIFVVSHDEHPVFFFFTEIKASSHIQQVSAGGDADRQMREQIKKSF